MDCTCPSCGGTSLSPSQDEGFLVCDDCHEQSQGFCREEMDDEDAGNFAVFTRQSQEAAVELKRLNAVVAGARANARVLASAARNADATEGLYRGVVIITRAIVDALIEGRYAPGEIVRPTHCIVMHWIRMCHAKGRINARGASMQDFKPRTILAMISLALLFARTSLLPRDVCWLAANNKIPFVTAGVDLLPSELMANPRLRTAFTPRLVYPAPEVAQVAAAIALSEYSWPPIRDLFDGPRKLYTHMFYRSFPVGQADVTIRRLTNLLGLPNKFCDRVLRFSELRRIATSMCCETHAHWKRTRGGRREDCTFHAKPRRSGVCFETDSDDEMKDIVHSSPGSPILTGQPASLESQPTQPELRSTAGRRMLLAEGLSQSPSQKASKPTGFRRRDVFSYLLEPGISELPFTPRHGKFIALDEFPTTRTVLVDFISTARLCYGKPEQFPEDSMIGEDVSSAELHAEWAGCVQRMKRWIVDGGDPSDSVTWAGLSPVALNNMRDTALKSFATESYACTDGDEPVFLSDASRVLRDVAKPHDDILTQIDGADPKPEQNHSRVPALRRLGTWVWDEDVEHSTVASRTKDVAENTSVDELDAINREVLLRIRGLITPGMQIAGISRGLHWWTLEDWGEDLWQEPAALGWMIHIANCFFHGTAGFVKSMNKEDTAYARHLARCCDVALANVFNYVDVYLGEEGRLHSEDPSVGQQPDPYVTESRMQGVGSGFHRAPKAGRT